LELEARALFENSSLLALGIVSITSILLIIVIDWRARIATLSVQFFGVFVLLNLTWPLALSISNLIAGWMAGAVLGMAMTSVLPETIQNTISKANPQSRYFIVWFIRQFHSSSFFYFLSAILVALFAFSLLPAASDFIPGSSDRQILAGLVLLGMGILQFSFRTDVLSTIIGLLTLFSGFELIYAAADQSTLVTGLFAVIILGIALVGAYLTIAPQMDAEE
jgi:hypothetical protein